MYLRRRYRRKDGKRHAYWALVESYRTAGGPRQRVVAYLGEMDEADYPRCKDNYLRFKVRKLVSPPQKKTGAAGL